MDKITEFKETIYKFAEEKIQNENDFDEKGKIPALEQAFANDPIAKEVAYMIATSHEYKKPNVAAGIKFAKNYKWEISRTNCNLLEGIHKPVIPTKVKDMAAKMGKKEPKPLITVNQFHGIRPQTPGKRILVDGHHRLEACKYNGLKDVPIYKGTYTGNAEKSLAELKGEKTAMFKEQIYKEAGFLRDIYEFPKGVDRYEQDGKTVGMSLGALPGAVAGVALAEKAGIKNRAALMGTLLAGAVAGGVGGYKLGGKLGKMYADKRKREESNEKTAGVVGGAALGYVGGMLGGALAGAGAANLIHPKGKEVKKLNAEGDKINKQILDVSGKYSNVLRDYDSLDELRSQLDGEDIDNMTVGELNERVYNHFNNKYKNRLDKTASLKSTLISAGVVGVPLGAIMGSAVYKSQKNDNTNIPRQKEYLKRRMDTLKEYQDYDKSPDMPRALVSREYTPDDFIDMDRDSAGWVYNTAKKQLEGQGKNINDMKMKDYRRLANKIYSGDEEEIEDLSLIKSKKADAYDAGIDKVAEYKEFIYKSASVRWTEHLRGLVRDNKLDEAVDMVKSMKRNGHVSTHVGFDVKGIKAGYLPDYHIRDMRTAINLSPTISQARPSSKQTIHEARITVLKRMRNAIKNAPDKMRKEKALEDARQAISGGIDLTPHMQKVIKSKEKAIDKANNLLSEKNTISR